MNTNLLTILAGGGILIAGIASYAGASSRDKYETPDYKVVMKDGAFEVRDYPEVVVASAPMKKEGGSRNSAFMGLFRYISGQNEAAQKISMTSPVISSMEEQDNTMSFVVPTEVAKAGAPQATDREIRIAKRDGGRFATYRYNGRWTEANETAARTKLMGWIKEQGLQMTGPVEKANYDPPFTLPALRRNEVLVRIKGA